MTHLPRKFALNFDPCFMPLSPEPTKSGRANYHCKSWVKFECNLTAVGENRELLFKMRAIITTFLLLVSALLTAAEEEKEIWACQATDVNGYSWENSKWERTGFSTKTYVLTVDGTDSFVKIDGDDYALECRIRLALEKVGCDDFDGYSIILDTNTGLGAFSKITGAAYEAEDGSKDAITISILHCTKVYPILLAPDLPT